MIEVNSFLDMVGKSEQPYLVLFWGSGCSPCDSIKPIFDKMETLHRDKVKFVSLKASENWKLAGHYRIIAVPTLLYVTNNLVNKKFIGPKTEEDIKVFLNAQGV